MSDVRPSRISKRSMTRLSCLRHATCIKGRSESRGRYDHVLVVIERHAIRRKCASSASGRKSDAVRRCRLQVFTDPVGPNVALHNGVIGLKSVTDMKLAIDSMSQAVAWVMIGTSDETGEQLTRVRERHECLIACEAIDYHKKLKAFRDEFICRRISSMQASRKAGD